MPVIYQILILTLYTIGLAYFFYMRGYNKGIEECDHAIGFILEDDDDASDE
jgi:hypothetical protein